MNSFIASVGVDIAPSICKGPVKVGARHQALSILLNGNGAAAAKNANRARRIAVGASPPLREAV
jgi:hypothetical protein